MTTRCNKKVADMKCRRLACHRGTCNVLIGNAARADRADVISDLKMTADRYEGGSLGRDLDTLVGRLEGSQ